MKEPACNLLGRSGLGELTLMLKWSDGRATHENTVYVSHFSVGQHGTGLPRGVDDRLAAMQVTDTLLLALPAGELGGAWREHRELTVQDSAFDREYCRGLRIEPQRGRFYPRAIFGGQAGGAGNDFEPARIIAVESGCLQIDLNHPLSRYPVMLRCELHRVHDASGSADTTCSLPLNELVRYAGLAASLPGGDLTDYGDSGAGMLRVDNHDDSVFYASPRLVQHIDARSLELINALYRRLLPARADVLDLMASHDSHLQGYAPRSLNVLGLNEAELEANEAATDRCVQDLNRIVSLPFENSSLDAAVCTVSVEYLTRPVDVFAELLRVLRPGGLFVTTFSNRWFPTKAISIWKHLHEFERVGLVTQWFQQAGFAGLHTYSSSGWPGVSDEGAAGSATASDPVYAVWGFRP